MRQCVFDYVFCTAISNFFVFIVEPVEKKNIFRAWYKSKLLKNLKTRWVITYIKFESYCNTSSYKTCIWTCFSRICTNFWLCVIKTTEYTRSVRFDFPGRLSEESREKDPILASCMRILRGSGCLKNRTFILLASLEIHRESYEASTTPATPPWLFPIFWLKILQPCDFFLFPKLKSIYFGSIEKIQKRMTSAFNHHSERDFQLCYDECLGTAVLLFKRVLLWRCKKCKEINQ